jgi:uncharacterized membrane protein (UPF0127 family)
VRYQVINETRANAVLCTQAEKALTFGARFKGLLGRTALEPGGGLHIEPCNSIHMFFMKFAIDVLFLDGELNVVRAISCIKPWDMTRVYSNAESVLELPVGVIAASQTVPGDRLRFLPAEP